MSHDGNSIIVDNSFNPPNDFELSTEISILESQNVRISIELIDQIADMINVKDFKISLITVFQE